MYTKQDSIFWWELERYTHQNKKFKHLSTSKKSFIEDSFRLAYYGIMQYQLYKGRQIQTIEVTNIDKMAHYINSNFESLYKSFLKNKKFKKYTHRERQEFSELLEELVIPYINDYSFETVDDFRISNENILGFIMQLAIKTQYDINILDGEKKPAKPFYSQIYPFMVTLMIMNPTTPDKIFDNVQNFYKPQMLLEHYHNGRSLSDEEVELLIPQIDLLNNFEDYNYFLFNFSEENWLKSDLPTRFKLVFQLTKLTSILLKENIYSLTFLENESEVYDLIEFYLPIVLQSEQELKVYKNSDETYYFEKQMYPKMAFLRPWMIKDFNPQFIEEYYEKHKVYDVEFDMDKLYQMMDMSVYAASYIRLLGLLGTDSPLLQKVLIDAKQLALVTTLKIFSLQDGKYVQQQNYDFRLNDVFLDVSTLKKIEGLKLVGPIKKNSLNTRINSILKLISYMLALLPNRVKDFGYSLDEIVRYYLILYGPYLKTKVGYQTNDFFLLTKKIIEIVTSFKNTNVLLETNEKQLIKNGYYLHIYLIEKLLEFSKNSN